MSKVIYAMGGVSADGYVVGPDGKFDWSVPDEELHRFHNEQTRALGGHLLGRRLYETMVFWETADQDPAAGAVIRDFALIWQALPKVVFSRTLDAVEGANARLARGDLRTELTALQETVEGDVAVGGPELAAEAARLDLIDEYRLFVHPVAVGGGVPFFPRDHRVRIRLALSRGCGTCCRSLRRVLAGTKAECCFARRARAAQTGGGYGVCPRGEAALRPARIVAPRFGFGPQRKSVVVLTKVSSSPA